MPIKSAFDTLHPDDVEQAVAVELQEDPRGCAACPYHRYGDAECLSRMLRDARDIARAYREGREP